jgi:hypothetical protein
MEVDGNRRGIGGGGWGNRRGISRWKRIGNRRGRGRGKGGGGGGKEEGIEDGSGVGIEGGEGGEYLEEEGEKKRE